MTEGSPAWVMMEVAGGRVSDEKKSAVCPKAKNKVHSQDAALVGAALGVVLWPVELTSNLGPCLLST